MNNAVILAFVALVYTVLGAPAGNAKTASKPPGQINTLERELEDVHQAHHPIISLQESQPMNSDDITVQKTPEIKRSERVSTDDVAEGDDDFTGLSGNLKAADQDVKDVLKTFFQNLKDHPEIVEEILSREGDKILGQPTGSDADVVDDTVVDTSAFQQPSPQLTQSPKHVEKKTGAFPQYPRFIYKSPMRNAEERDEMTSASKHNTEQRSGSFAHSNIVTNGAKHLSKFKVDINNAIPVIQQPSTMHKTDESMNIVPDQLEEGGAMDLNALRQEQEEYSQQHPFINPLPIFPQAPQTSSNTAKENEVLEPKTHAEETEKEQPLVNERGEPLLKKSTDETGSSESSEEQDDHGEEEEEEKAGGTEEAQAVPPQAHALSGSEIAAETLAHPVESESKVPYYYYYYYDEDGNKITDEEAAEGEEATEEEEPEEDDEETQLDKISNEDEAEEEIGEEEEEEEEDDEEGTENVSSQEEDEEKEQADDSIEDSVEEPENDEEDNEDEEEDIETHTNIQEETKLNQETHSSTEAQGAMKQKVTPLDTNEVSLMSLNRSRPRQKQRVIGPAM